MPSRKFSIIPIVYAAAICAFSAPLLAQQRFDSADAAAKALIAGAEKHDSAILAAILGPAGHAILTSGNQEQDMAEETEFASLAHAKYRLEHDARNPNRMILCIGDEDWPFPVPIVRSNGKWSFDAKQSRVEMRARHIGADELAAIETCAAYAAAQIRYASEVHDTNGLFKYASHIVGTGSRGDALFPEGAGDRGAPQGLVDAIWEGSKKALKPYHGYYFRVLDGQGPHAPGGPYSYIVKNTLMGGFGLVAWPAQFGTSGIQTFIVNQDRVIYQKDLGPSTGRAGGSVTRYDPDSSWKKVE